MKKQDEAKVKKAEVPKVIESHEADQEAFAENPTEGVAKVEDSVENPKLCVPDPTEVPAIERHNEALRQNYERTKNPTGYAPHYEDEGAKK